MLAGNIATKDRGTDHFHLLLHYQRTRALLGCGEDGEMGDEEGDDRERVSDLRSLGVRDAVEAADKDDDWEVSIRICMSVYRGDCSENRFSGYLMLGEVIILIEVAVQLVYHDTSEYFQNTRWTQ